MSEAGHTLVFLWRFTRLLQQDHPDVDLSALLAELDIPDPAVNPQECMITPLQEATFVHRACALCGDLDLAFRAGLAHRDPSNLHGYIARHSSTLRDAIHNAMRYGPAVHPEFQLALDESGNVARMQLVINNASLSEAPRYFEALFASALSQIRNHTGRAFYPAAMSFMHRRAEVGRQVRARLGCPVEFGAPTYEIQIGLGMMDAPLNTRDDILRRFLETEGERVLSARKADRLSAANTAELLIEQSLPHHLPTLDEIAREMGMSARSLSRRLQDEKTSFSEIVSHVRLRVASRELSDTDHAIGDIAYRLGYASQSAFSAAFRRETGLSPRAFRSAQAD